MKTRIGVVGLWHLGCVLSASWSILGHDVVGIDFDQTLVAELAEGRPPLYEPQLSEAIAKGLAAQRLAFSTDPHLLAERDVIFLAYDTPVDEEDRPDTEVLIRAIETCGPHLASSGVVVVSSQLPVGFSDQIRERLNAVAPGVDLVYSPENLRLGEAIDCYLKPGHIVIGGESDAARAKVIDLFRPMNATILEMDLASAELAKHAINAYLATSITFINQLADVSHAVGADILDVIKVMRNDPRIGPQAYLSPGLGFSGGTLGRDLQVLDAVNRDYGLDATLFGDIWAYNNHRYHVVTRLLTNELGGLDGRTIVLLGITYKPGTSTFRRSLPLAVAIHLLTAGSEVRVYDPKADFGGEVEVPDGLKRYADPLEAAVDADAVVLLTEWPEFQDIDFSAMKNRMGRPLILDTKNFLVECGLESRGYRYIGIGRKSQ